MRTVLAEAGERARGLLSPAGAIDRTERFAGPYRKLSDEQKRITANLVGTLIERGETGTLRLSLRAAGRDWDERGLAALYIQAAIAAGTRGEAALQGRLLEEAVHINRSAGALRALMRYYNQHGRLDEAVTLANELEKLEGSTAHPQSASLIKLVRQKHGFWMGSGSYLDRLGRFRHSAWQPDSCKMLYVAHNTLPYATGGYATRTDGILRGIQKTGYKVLALSRPGYPLDSVRGLSAEQIPAVDEIAGIVYRRLLGSSRRGLNQSEYIEASADCLEVEMAREQPAVVQAASNYQTGAPALIAARRLGIPFIYEVRGFWEITRASREPAFAETTEYEAMSRLEAETAARADAVITLTSAMKEELIRRGVPGERIVLVHNSVDPDRFTPIPRNQELAAKLGLPSGVPVIGYVGSHVEYEGLDLLIEAAALLRQDGLDFRILLVGDGSVTGDVLKLAGERGLGEQLVFTGRIPNAEVEAHYSLIDVCPFPRKPWPVCELVSPMKPFEALAMSKAVIVADTRALAEIIEHERTGLHFRKGNAPDLADKLARCITDKGLRDRLGAAGREWVLEHRTWDGAGRTIGALFERVIKARSGRNAPRPALCG